MITIHTRFYLFCFRFAQFFISPLFNEDSADREVNAVNSEHEKNLQSDAWRFDQLEKSSSKLGHPFRKFGTGKLCSDFKVNMK